MLIRMIMQDRFIEFESLGSNFQVDKDNMFR